MISDFVNMLKSCIIPTTHHEMMKKCTTNLLMHRGKEKLLNTSLPFQSGSSRLLLIELLEV
jgi:hypothetical protein